MIIDMWRLSHGDDSTLGVLKDGSFTAFTCEDEFREEKLHGETRIPAGDYEIKLRNEGGMNEKYLLKYPEFHRGMLHLQDVPGFEWIYIHTGNNESHTEGCILVGYKADIIDNNGGEVYRSRSAYSDLYKRIIKAMDRGEKVEIHIRDYIGPA